MGAVYWYRFQVPLLADAQCKEQSHQKKKTNRGCDVPREAENSQATPGNCEKGKVKSGPSHAPASYRTGRARGCRVQIDEQRQEAAELACMARWSVLLT